MRTKELITVMIVDRKLDNIFAVRIRHSCWNNK